MSCSVNSTAFQIQHLYNTSHCYYRCFINLYIIAVGYQPVVRYVQDCYHPVIETSFLFFIETDHGLANHFWNFATCRVRPTSDSPTEKENRGCDPDWGHQPGSTQVQATAPRLQLSWREYSHAPPRWQMQHRKSTSIIPWQLAHCWCGSDVHQLELQRWSTSFGLPHFTPHPENRVLGADWLPAVMVLHPSPSRVTNIKDIQDI